MTLKTRKLMMAMLGLVPTMAVAQQKPNIIYIMCDDMGYGDLGCYGQQLISTPNLDKMATEGMRFTDAYAGSPVSAMCVATANIGIRLASTKRCLTVVATIPLLDRNLT